MRYLSEILIVFTDIYLGFSIRTFFFLSLHRFIYVIASFGRGKDLTKLGNGGGGTRRSSRKKRKKKIHAESFSTRMLYFNEGSSSFFISFWSAPPITSRGCRNSARIIEVFICSFSFGSFMTDSVSRFRFQLYKTKFADKQFSGIKLEGATEYLRIFFFLQVIKYETCIYGI